MWDILQSGQRPKMMTNGIQKIKELFEGPATFVFLSPKLSQQRDVLPQSPLMPLRQLWTLHQGCRTLYHKQGHQQVFCSKLPWLFLFPPACHIFWFSPEGICSYSFWGAYVSVIWQHSMVYNLEQHPSLRSKYIFLHHFLQLTARILEDKNFQFNWKPVFNNNVLPGFSDP